MQTAKNRFSVCMISFLLHFQQHANGVAATPAFWSGWFTVKSNNPAFQCNPAEAGRVFNDVVVEARINKFTNEHDSTYKGGHCDFLVLNECDLRVRGAVNADRPLDNWPSDLNLVELIHEWSGNDIKPDNYQYGVEHEKHAFILCQRVPTLSIATVHIEINDVDATSATDIVNRFNCHWSPKRVGSRRSSAKWDTINCCTAFTREMRSTVRQEFKLDIRAYKASDRDTCPAEGRL